RVLKDLNHTPASDESLRLSGAVRLCCGFAATLTEQPARGSLVQAQTRSRLVICAQPLQAMAGRKGGQSPPPPKKKHPAGCFFFGGEGGI
ncbi:MAG: hypothetical protein J6R89_06175, partial [Clostridia bacterium]|nr:hypothetical protein [Clostridia bacterium]